MRPPTAKRYLAYLAERSPVAGINHQRSNLRCLLGEAHALGRIAILPPLCLDPAFNFGVARDWCWTTYVDLDRSVMVDPDGGEHPLPLTDRAPSGTAAVTVGGGPLPPGADDAPLLVRRLRPSIFRHAVPPPVPPMRFRWRASARVTALAAPVIATMRARAGPKFAAVHVRRGDRLPPPLDRLVSPARIVRHLRACGIEDGTAVFFLSDERRASFWAPLEQRYDVVRYLEFPALADLVEPHGDGPDNYLLYEVEQEIMRCAAQRIETFPNPYGNETSTLLLPAVAHHLGQAGPAYGAVLRRARALLPTLRRRT